MTSVESFDDIRWTFLIKFNLEGVNAKPESALLSDQLQTAEAFGLAVEIY